MATKEGVDVGAVLRSNRLLSELDPRQMSELVALGRTVKIPANVGVFQKGEPGDCLYAILKGQIGVHTSSASGKFVLLNILDPGDVLGEIALVDGKPRTASASALRPSVLFRLDRPEFLAFLERHPPLCIRMMMVLCERLRWVSENIEDAIFHDVPRRLARRLLLLADTYGQPGAAGSIRITQPISQESLASMLGVTREMVNKTLRALQKTGAVSYNKGFIVLNNRVLLREMAGDPADE